MISDDEFAKGIEYLMQNGMLYVDAQNVKVDSASSNQIPSWIRNNADWWSQGLLTDDEFVNGMHYLVKYHIIQIEYSSG